MPRPGYKSVYFPNEELWKKIVDEAEKRKVSVYEVLKDAFECYMRKRKEIERV